MFGPVACPAYLNYLRLLGWPTPFNGAACVNGTDCALGEKCSMYSPHSPGNRGECRLPCDQDAPCQPRAGVPQVCLDNGRGG